MSASASVLPWWSLRQRGRRVWLVHLILLGVFAVLAVMADALRADSPDVWVTAHIQRWQGVDGLMRAVSWFGSAPEVVLIDGALTLGLYALRARVAAALLLLSVAGAGILAWLVKALVGRPRPAGPAVHVLAHADGFSFPSGHVVAYVALFGFLAYLARIRLRSRVLRWGTVSLCLVLLVLIGPSRIYLGAHWASDVLGAYLLGGVWLSVVLRAYVAWQERAASAAAGHSALPFPRRAAS
jgi:undecaprenyl-diphosphatase